MIAVLHALRYAIVLRSCHRNLVQSLYLMPFHIQNRLILNLGYDILCIQPKMIIRKIVITEQASTFLFNQQYYYIFFEIISYRNFAVDFINTYCALFFYF